MIHSSFQGGWRAAGKTNVTTRDNGSNKCGEHYPSTRSSQNLQVQWPSLKVPCLSGLWVCISYSAVPYKKCSHESDLCSSKDKSVLLWISSQRQKLSRRQFPYSNVSQQVFCSHAKSADLQKFLALGVPAGHILGAWLVIQQWGGRRALHRCSEAFVEKSQMLAQLPAWWTEKG